MKSEQTSSKIVKSINSPNLMNIKKIGIVSRDYGIEDKNQFRDFSYAFENILLHLDKQGCDSVIFSLYTLVERKSFDVKKTLNDIKTNNIKTIFIEEFSDNKKKNERKEGDFVIYFKDNNIWQEYRLTQKFGKLRYT